MPKTTVPGQTIALPKPPPGWFDFAYVVTPNGELGLVRCDRDYFAEYRAWHERSTAVTIEEQDRGESPPPRPDLSGSRLRISRFDGRIESSPIEVLSDRWAKVASLPDGGWLGSKGGRFQRYTAEGEPTGALDLGGYIEHIGVTPGGAIWVGYFDQGIFARPGPDGRVPVSASGIARFDPDGTLLWRFNWRDELSVWDCYSLTIDGDRVWSCPYGDPNFPIVLIDDDRVRFWGNEFTGVKAVAADGDHAILAGGYAEDSNRVALLRLGTADATPVREWRFAQPGRHTPQLMQGLGSTLHLIGDGRWRRVTIRDLLDAEGGEPAPSGFGVL